jgi:N-sulfoglucosamine sulfohydrolase
MVCLRSALILALLAVPRAYAQERPNVLWLTVEDMSPWIACYGDDTVPTPNLDRLAAASIRYTNAFATSPVCAAARSSLITGEFCTRIGTMHHRTGNPSAAAIEANPEAYAEIPSYEGVPPAFVRCFPELLRAAGYFCTNSAKTDYQFQAPATVWDASNGKAHWRNRPDGRPFFAVFNHGGTHESQAFPGARPRPSAVAPEDVPVPPIYPDTPTVRAALARTYDNIAAMDAWVGERLAELEEAGLASSTVVFFFSDHGVGLPRGKRSPYDLGTRVPLLVRFPDGQGAGTTESRVVSFVDLGPTVLSLAGIEPDARLDGVPFLGPHARPGSGLAFANADRFDAVYDRARSVTDGRFRYVRNLAPELPYLLPNAYRERLPMTSDLHALQESGPRRAQQWQVAARSRPAEELYDSSTDPWEVENLAGSPEHAQVLARLRAALDAWIEDTGDLGLVLPEARMVAEHLWPDLVQPVTAQPTLRPQDGLVTLSSETPGASLGYRAKETDAWTVYTTPFAAGDASRLEVLAHRIGFAPATRWLEVR